MKEAICRVDGELRSNGHGGIPLEKYARQLRQKFRQGEQEIPDEITCSTIVRRNSLLL